MKKNKTVIVAVIFIVGVAAAFWLRRDLAIDGCLDSGGRWNYSLSHCEKK